MGIMNSYHGMESAADRFLRILNRFVPDFVWGINTLHLGDYLFPQTRTRTFIRGINRRITEALPPPLPPFGKRTLRDVLSRNLPHTPRSEFTEQRQINLKMYETKKRQGVDHGELSMDDVCVVAVDRQHGKTFKQIINVNKCCTLTTTNRYLFVLSVADVMEGVPDHKRELFRLLTACERLTLQSFPADNVLTLGDPPCVEGH